ncbi:hypothetical protein [Gallaecimonas mangrovi]|uniref:hypothetical protein n=1 Tax=Gallaecimonas mangrovi TaxID=2291597 RepID=UPI000E203561|nr:hypothetical protein [Gallaecimonas mangrovi]
MSIRTFKGSDKLIYGQAVGTVIIVAAAIVINSTQYIEDMTGRGLLWSLAAVLGAVLLLNWFMDTKVHGLTFNDDNLEIRYRRRRIQLARTDITRIESVGSIRTPAWFIYADNQRYLVQTQNFPHWIRLQILDQMQKFRAGLC